MKKWKGTVWAAGLLALAGAVLWALEIPAPVGPEEMRTPYGSLLVPENLSPKVQTAELTGTIIAIDTIGQRLTVEDPRGITEEFLVDSLVPIADRHIQITFRNLRVGDHVTIRYRVHPLHVTNIDRF